MRIDLCRAISGVGAVLFLTLLSVAGSAQDNDGPAVEVTVAPLSTIGIADERSASAEVVPRHRAVLAAEVTGRVVAVEADTGDGVAANDVLVRIDPTVYELALQRAEAELASVLAEIERARSRLERIDALAQRDYASEDELQVETTSLAVLERTRDIRRVARDQARVDLARTRVVAPFAGAVQARTAQIGNWVGPGTALLTLVQTGDREVATDMHPAQAASLADAVDLRFDSDGGTAPLTIVQVSPVVDPVTRMQAVRLAFRDEPVRIGTLGDVRWRTVSGRIPADFVLQRNGRLGVFVADGTRARFVELPGASEGRPAEHDLPENTPIIVDGRQRVRDGDLLRISEP